jgi:hypothetical protein
VASLRGVSAIKRYRIQPAARAIKLYAECLAVECEISAAHIREAEVMMARYRLLEPHFLGDYYFLAGAIVDWPGPPSRHMEAVDPAAEQALAEFAEQERARGRPLPRRRTKNRAHLNSALHSPSSAPGDKPLWRGFEPVPESERGKPPKLPQQ